MLVVRATDAWRELQVLLEALSPLQQRVCILSTFADKLPDQPDPLRHFCQNVLGVPYLSIDARRLDELQRLRLLQITKQSRQLPINAAQLLATASPSDAPSLIPADTIRSRSHRPNPSPALPWIAFCPAGLSSLPAFRMAAASAWKAGLFSQPQRFRQCPSIVAASDDRKLRRLQSGSVFVHLGIPCRDAGRFIRCTV